MLSTGADLVRVAYTRAALLLKPANRAWGALIGVCPVREQARTAISANAIANAARYRLDIPTRATHRPHDTRAGAALTLKLAIRARGALCRAQQREPALRARLTGRSLRTARELTRRTRIALVARRQRLKRARIARAHYAALALRSHRTRITRRLAALALIVARLALLALGLASP